MRELVDVFERIEAARGSTTLTFFEYNTLAALLLFADQKVDVAVLEVGLGGRLDAVNLVDADVSVLCSVGFDHRDWLGDTLEAIGAEKAGIFRARPTGRARHAAAAPQRICRHRAAGCPGGGGRAPVQLAHRSRQLDLSGLARRVRGYSRATARGRHPVPQCGHGAGRGRIAGANRGPGLALAAAAPPGHRRGIGESRTWPGASRCIPGPVEWILDVAHNEPAAQILKANLAERPLTGRTLAVCGILQDKDAGEIARVLARSAQIWIACALPGPRGGTAAELAARLAPQHPRRRNRRLLWPRAVRGRASLRGRVIGCSCSAVSAP